MTPSSLTARLAQAKQRPVPVADTRPEWVKRLNAGKLPARVTDWRPAA